MSADVTKIPVNSAAAWLYIYDALVAARAASAQVPIPTSSARRLTFQASADMRLTTDPTAEPLGILLDADIPQSFESGIGPAGEDVRKYFVMGVGDLEVTQEY